MEGASDLEAFEKLLRLEELEGINAEVRCISNLHAKVYIFDEDSAIVTSSNLTASGLKSNIEYGIEVMDPVAIQQMLDDMGTYWNTAEILTTDILQQIGERLETTESVVKVDQAAQERKNRLSIGNSSTSVQSIGKRITPLGQDLENAGLDNLRGTILTSTSKYRKRTKVIITPPEDFTDIEDKPSVDSSLSTGKTKSSTIEVETSYSELEEDSVEQLISELKDNDKQKRKDARIRLEALIVLDDSCIVPYITELSIANIDLCCRFLRLLQDSKLAVSHLLRILNVSKAENGLLPFLVLKTLNDIAPERLFSFLCKTVKDPLSNNAKRHAVKEVKKAIVKLNLEEDDSAIGVLKQLVEDTDTPPTVCNTIYLTLGEIGGTKAIDYLRNAFKQAESRKIPLASQMSILKGLIHAGITPIDEMMFERLTYNSHVRFRTISIRALRQSGEKYWHRLSAMAESDPDVDVRTQAVRALANIDAAAAHKILIKLREIEPEEDLRNTISSLIQRYEESIRNLSVDEKQLLQSLASDLQSSDHKIRRKAATDLSKLKHMSVVEPLCSALKDEDIIVRAAAAESLGRMNNNLSVPPLIEVLENDPYPHARAAAAKALGIIGDNRAFEAISNGLTDKNGNVQKWCRRSISKLR
jgi:HEAT repeat protein